MVQSLLSRERLEDLHKYRRERAKGFNKYVREFHKRKERLYREKIDRIQREKINLLKINDVEGYLRMVKVSSDIINTIQQRSEFKKKKLKIKIAFIGCKIGSSEATIERD